MDIGFSFYGTPISITLSLVEYPQVLSYSISFTLFGISRFQQYHCIHNFTTEILKWFTIYSARFSEPAGIAAKRRKGRSPLYGAARRNTLGMTVDRQSERGGLAERTYMVGRPCIEVRPSGFIIYLCLALFFTF